MSYVIAVAAPIGGGKTSLVNAIAERLEDAATLFYDRYERTTRGSVRNLREWMRSGADFNAFVVPGLSDALDRLKQGRSVLDPMTGEEILPKRFIIFEMPLGKEHSDTARYIDLLLWIEVPFDIAFARKVKEYTGDFLAHHEPNELRRWLMWLDQYLENYLDVVGDVLRIQRDKIGVKADIVIDGRLDFGLMVEEATREIMDRMA